MPTKFVKNAYKKRPAKKPTKKVFKKRTVKYSSGPRITGPFKAYSSADPFKPKMFCKQTYSDSVILTAGAAGLYGTEKVYRLNSLFDPDFTGVGHQPYGYDQMSLLYRKYKVSGCLIEITINDPSADGMVFGAQIQPPSGTFSLTSKGLTVLNEQPMSFTRTINDSGKQSRYFKSYVPIGKVSGLTELQFKADDDVFQASTGANPAWTPFLCIAAANVRADASTLNVRMKLTYYSHFFDRIVLAQS